MVLFVPPLLSRVRTILRVVISFRVLFDGPPSSLIFGLFVRQLTVGLLYCSHRFWTENCCLKLYSGPPPTSLNPICPCSQKYFFKLFMLFCWRMRQMRQVPIHLCFRRCFYSQLKIHLWRRLSTGCCPWDLWPSCWRDWSSYPALTHRRGCRRGTCDACSSSLFYNSLIYKSKSKWKIRGEKDKRVNEILFLYKSASVWAKANVPPHSPSKALSSIF